MLALASSILVGRSKMQVKCYGSTAGLHPASVGSTPIIRTTRAAPRSVISRKDVWRVRLARGPVPGQSRSANSSPATALAARQSCSRLVSGRSRCDSGRGLRFLSRRCYGSTRSLYLRGAGPTPARGSEYATDYRRCNHMQCRCGQELTGRQRRWCSDNCRNKFAVTTWRQRLKRRAVEFMGGKCERCGYAKCDAALTFHHPHDKHFGISAGGNTRAWARVKEELKICELVCMNCHAEIHHEERVGNISG